MGLDNSDVVLNTLCGGMDTLSFYESCVFSGDPIVDEGVKWSYLEGV